VSRARLAITLAYHGALVVPGRAGPVLFRGLDPLPAARGRPCRHLRSCRTTAFERRSSPLYATHRLRSKASSSASSALPRGF